MSDGNLTNEQKLTYVYEVVKEQEERRKQKILFRWLFRGLIFAFFLFFYVNRESVLIEVEKGVKMMISSLVSRVFEAQKEQIKEGSENLGEEAARILDSIMDK